MIEITYNNEIYQVNPEDSLNALLQRGDLLALPLSVWKELFIKKDGDCSLACMRQVLLKKIDLYDHSSNVNCFYYKDSPAWLDKETRMGLMHLANCSDSTIRVIMATQVVEMPVDTFKDFLKRLEVYAGQCYVNTAIHKQEAFKLQTIDDMINYEYTANYPSKLML